MRAPSICGYADSFCRSGRSDQRPAAPRRRPATLPFILVEAPMLTPDKDLITRFSAIVGEKYALTDPDLQAAYLHEMRDRWVGHHAAGAAPRDHRTGLGRS